MTEIGAYEAKTHLSELLARVADGEQVVITKPKIDSRVNLPGPKF